MNSSDKKGNIAQNDNKKQFHFQEKKENFIGSLHQVEYFLHHFKKIAKGMKLYRLLK